MAVKTEKVSAKTKILRMNKLVADLKKKAEVIENKIIGFNNKISLLQKECKHPIESLDATNRGNLLDVDDNPYTVFYCNECDMMWREEGTLCDTRKRTIV